MWGVGVAERSFTRQELEVLHFFRRRLVLRRPPRGPYMNAKPSLMLLLYFHAAQETRAISGIIRIRMVDRARDIELPNYVT